MERTDFACAIAPDRASAVHGIATAIHTVRTHLLSLPGWQRLSMEVTGRDPIGNTLTVPVITSMLCPPSDQYVSMGVSMNIRAILGNLPAGDYHVVVSSESVDPPSFPNHPLCYKE